MSSNNINGVNQNIFEQINSKSQAQNTSGTSKTAEDSDMFMRLMIAQLSNQDPTSPAETTDFMQQIATMSQVESINQLNTSVQNMAQTMLTSQAALQASSMVGRSVYVPGDTVEVGTASSPYAHGAFSLENSASDVRIQVYDSSGSLVETLNLGAVTPGNHDFAWQMPADESGQPIVPPGDFTFTVERMVDGEYQPVNTRMAYTVNSVTLGENGIGMKVNTNAGTFDVSEVEQIGV